MFTLYKGGVSIKRFLCILILISLLLTGCSGLRKPANLSSTCYTIAMNVLSATDQYLDKQITAVIAAGQIQDLCRTLSSLPDEEGTRNQDVKNYCEMLSYTIMLVADGDHINEKEIIHTRNYLATLLGQDIRE